MGFVEWYTIVVFFLGVIIVAYSIGADESLRFDDPYFVRFFYRWLGMLPLIGRVFEWW